MFIAMNRFKVMKGCEHDFEQVWLNRESASRRDAGLHRLPSAEGAGARGPRPLFLAHHVALARRLRGLDQVGAVPQGARPRRRQQAAVCSAIPSSRASRAAGGDGRRHARRRRRRVRRVVAHERQTQPTAEQRPTAGGAALPQRRRHRSSRSRASTASARSRSCAISAPSSARSSPAQVRGNPGGPRDLGRGAVYRAHAPTSCWSARARSRPAPSAAATSTCTATARSAATSRPTTARTSPSWRAPFMGRASRSIQFFNAAGEAMFKIFVRRDKAARADR